MARYIGPMCRLCRRSGEKLMLKGERCFTPKCAVERRERPPGQIATRRRRISDRGVQLREKQKARYSYEMLEAQFKRFFYLAEKQPGITGDNLAVLLERRLDNAVFRLGFADSRAQARQLVTHGHIIVNGHKIDIPSYLVEANDVIAWREGSKKNKYYQGVAANVESKIVPTWLSLDKENLSGQVLSLPIAANIETKVDGKTIVEYYSR